MFFVFVCLTKEAKIKNIIKNQNIKLLIKNKKKINIYLIIDLKKRLTVFFKIILIIPNLKNINAQLNSATIKINKTSAHSVYKI